MKKLPLILLVLCLCITMVSCSNDLEETTTIVKANTRTVQNDSADIKANLQLVKYLKLVDSVYVLDITFDEAKSLGVTKQQYDKALSDIAIVNRVIGDAISNNKEVYLKNPQE